MTGECLQQDELLLEKVSVSLVVKIEDLGASKNKFQLEPVIKPTLKQFRFYARSVA